MDNKTDKERLASIEVEIQNIKESINDIKDNHLASIYKKLECFESKLISRLPAWGVIIITFLSSLSVGLIVWTIRMK